MTGSDTLNNMVAKRERAQQRRLSYARPQPDNSALVFGARCLARALRLISIFPALLSTVVRAVRVVFGDQLLHEFATAGAKVGVVVGAMCDIAPVWRTTWIAGFGRRFELVPTDFGVARGDCTHVGMHPNLGFREKKGE
jgi:hypothetical protein